ncbi:DUF3387 domain-containing protein [Romboutsia sedimentorum]|uniref:DUF3387 domain-containing protein n=1 Tax=Romboutsia sedimentorum TaxID=1368474 RepID=A0ABT7E837_9FIRM|nr:type I restriction enzyme endonuclease domain-containing protein [Romboutsia sedimentorum]MDK2562238.1 DUF3387 domain-containing protein [Romboutsia sedimentorum]
MKGKFSKMEAIVGSPNRVKQLAADIVSHYEDKGNTGIDACAAIAVMMEKLELLREILYRYDYTDFMTGSPRERMNAITGGMNFILGLNEQSQKEFKLLCIELAKAHSLCAATDEGREVALEVSYFKALKASLMKLAQRCVQKKTKKEIEDRVNQLLERSIMSEEVIDVSKVFK